MGEQIEKINIIELLMGIKEDTSSLKTDMTNFKEIQRTEKNTIMKEISDVRTDYKRDLADMKSYFIAKINGLQAIQNNLCGDVDSLKHAEDKKDAKKYRMTFAFVATGLGGMILAKLPEFINFCINLKGD